MKKLIAILALSLAAVGCTRIPTGEIGLRVDINKQVQGTELVAGSWNQTLVGDVLEFPVRDVGIIISDRRPLTSENTPLGDLDAVVVYNIEPSAVSDFWSKKSRSFHFYDAEKKDWYLMQNYITTMIDNAIIKVVRQYKALEVNDNRKKIEDEIKLELNGALKSEGLQGAITFGTIQVKNMQPPTEILQTAIAVVKSQNELKVKENEVKIAEAEKRRMDALSANSGSSIAYMDAEARKMMAQAMLAGKVHTVVVPYDFKGIVNAK